MECRALHHLRLIMYFSRPIIAALSLVAVANAAPQLDSIFNTITSDIVSVATQVGSGAASIATGVFETVTSDGGHAVTVVTSVGGEAITLATDGVGDVTSFAGSEYTVAKTAAVGTNTGNAAVPAMGISPSLIAGLATVLASACLGAVITI
ncbi:hypothetical protein C8F01DRAFT_1109230 [Mycena amicta]|nr:hypothetical protein C8F01DRAFT_1109230 [Mycena amicta]